jgi:hypothetical protein
MKHVRKVGSVAHQASASDEFALKVDRRDRMMGGQCDELLELARQERIGKDEKRSDPMLYEGYKGGFGLAFGAGFQDMELQPDCSASRLCAETTQSCSSGQKSSRLIPRNAVLSSRELAARLDRNRITLVAFARLVAHRRSDFHAVSRTPSASTSLACAATSRHRHIWNQG